MSTLPNKTNKHLSTKENISNKKQILDIENEFEQSQEIYLHKMELFKQRERILKAKDLYLQEALINFNHYLKDNEHKRKRAEYHIYEEISQKQQLQQDILHNKNHLKN